MAAREPEPPAAVRALTEQVESDGGQALAVYREPVGKQWHVFCLLPIERVAPTPYQRDI
jgi:ParB family chromosome partitioning protein